MRFMVIVPATKESEAGVLPEPEHFEKMHAFNETLAKDGVLLAADGLHASSKGARIAFGGKTPVVTDGPFAESKELIAGFWIVQAKSKEEVVERFLRCPFGEISAEPMQIEIRQIFEAEDFGENLPPAVAAGEQRMCSEIASRS